MKIVGDVFGGSTLLWWIYLKPIVMAFGQEHRDPTIYRDFEWLASRVREVQRAAGGVSPTDELARELIAPTIARYAQRIAVFEQERTVMAEARHGTAAFRSPRPTAATHGERPPRGPHPAE